MIFQPIGMGDLGCTSVLLYIKATGIVTHTIQTMRFPLAEVSLNRCFCGITTFTLPAIHRNLGS